MLEGADMDVAAEVVTYLSDVTGFPWYHEAPTNTPDEFGTATRDGGPSELVRDTATVTLMVHAATRGRAADLASETKLALLLMPYEVANVFHVEVMGDYYDPLDVRSRHRITTQILVND